VGVQVKGVKMSITVFGGRKNKPEYDFYETPEQAVNKILDVQKLRGDVLEPCAGNGNISNVVNKRYKKPFTVEINKNLKADVHVDFLQWKTKKRFDTVIMNPPFSLNNNGEFLLKSKSLLRPNGLIIMLVQIQWLGSKKRQILFKNVMYPTKCFLLHERLNFNGKTGIYYCWLVWDFSRREQTVLKWI
jgi:hypothetical protein